MRKNIIVSTILLTLLIVTTHSFASNRSIKWIPISSSNQSENSIIRKLNFKNAFFKEKNQGLPSYFEMISMDLDGFTAKVSLINPRYVPLAAEEKKAVEGLEFKEEIELIVSRVYQNKKAQLSIEFIPIKKEALTNNLLKLVSFDFDIQYIPDEDILNSRFTNYVDNSVLATGVWHKFKLNETGVYKITYSDLESFGIDAGNINPRNIRIYGNGGGMLPEANSENKYFDLQENAISVFGEGDGSFDQNDYILFYGEGPDSWEFNPLMEAFSIQKNIYSDYTYYFINTDLGLGKRIQIQESSTQNADTIIENFQDRAFHNEDLYNLIGTGRTWFGETFDALSEQTFSFLFPNIDLSKIAVFKTKMAARSSSTNIFQISEGNNNFLNFTIGNINFSGSYPPYAVYKSSNFVQFNPTSDNVDITIKYLKPNSNSNAWLDNMEMSIWRKLIFSGNQMSFRHVNGNDKLTRFKLSNASNVVVWNVSDPLSITQIDGSYIGDKFEFNIETPNFTEFISYNGQEFLSVDFVEAVENQNYNGIPICDMIIVSHPLFYAQAKRLGDYHLTKDNITYCIVEPEKIYNEFSSGAQDISAIRNFVRRMYDMADVGNEPKYLLLFGDASYDFKDISIDSNTNFVPSWQSEQSVSITSSWVTDDYFGLLDNNEGSNIPGNPIDINIGRIPVANEQDAKLVIDKILHYDSNSEAVMGSWRSTLCFVGDDEDNNAYVNDSEGIAYFIEQNIENVTVDKIYFDSFEQVSTPGGNRYPAVQEQINQKVKKGALIMNYIGHGGETGWAHERVLEINDIRSWDNFNTLPLFITATCEFTRFDDPERVSAGEEVFLNPYGGGVALLSTTRTTSGGLNERINKEVIKKFYTKVNGEYCTLGEVITSAKNALGNNINYGKFTLIGDPALKLAIPKDSISTVMINDHVISNVTDTIGALAEVNISGSVYNQFGIKMDNFNGIIYPTVYDKESELTTLGQDNGSSEYVFYLRNNILYKGKSSVVNGDFSFSFFVPKDIAYNYGYGKISYYAHDGESDAWGVFNNIVVGGYDEEALTDFNGPLINLYMNNEYFENGGITDNSPSLLAIINDEKGINTTGNGIGHDIVAVLDDDIDQTYVLNSYYETDLDSYGSGKVLFPFSNLSEGIHRIDFKVWDIYNNSSESSIEFVVKNNSVIEIQNLMNFPNPFSGQTSFQFAHNKPNEDLKVEVNIYAMNGKLMKSIREIRNVSGYTSEPILWNGHSDGGYPLSSGIYIYKVKIETANGRITQGQEKLIIY